MRALIITTREPYPEIGGERIRLGLIGRALATKFAVDVVVAQDPSRRLADSRVPPYAEAYESIRLGKAGAAARSLLAGVSGKSAQTAAFITEEVGARIREYSRRSSVVVFHLARTTEYLKFVSGTPVLVAELTDAISMNYEAYSRAEGIRFLKRQAFRYEARRLREYEAKITGLVDHTWVVAERDARAIEAAGGRRPAVLPNAYPIGEYQFNPYRRGKKIAIVGDFVSVQNLDGLQWFLSNAFPVLRLEGFGVKVVGNISSVHMSRFQAIDGVEVTGRVPSISGALQDCAIGLCPVRAAGGLQNKIVEYAAVGLPIVTSLQGLEGLPAAMKAEVYAFAAVRDCQEQIRRACGGGKELEGSLVRLRRYVANELSEEVFRDRVFEQIGF